MKKNYALIILQFALNITVHGQITFQKSFGGTGDDYGNSVQQTFDGGYIIAGSTNSFGTGGSNVYLIKTNSNGDTLWTKSYDFVNGNDYGYSIQQTLDSGYVITGSAEFIARDICFFKTDKNGNILWARNRSGDFDDEGYSVELTSVDSLIDFLYILAGASNSFGAGLNDVFLNKNGETGVIWWETIGGTGDDECYSIEHTSDNGYIIAGATNSFGAGDDDVYLIKTDSIGGLVWTKAYGGTGSDGGYSVQQTNDGGYIIGGYTNSFGAADSDVYLIRTDSSGGILWSKTFGGSGSDVGKSVHQTNDGGYIIAGYTSSFGAGDDDVYVIKTDASGDTLWTRVFGGTLDDRGYSIQQTFDGGYVIDGFTGFGAGNEDIYLIKTDSLGNSGCNQSTPMTIITTPATQVTTSISSVSVPDLIVGPFAPAVTSGSIANTLCLATGVNGALGKENGFSVFPNPSAGSFIIQASIEFKNVRVEIFNILGKKIYSEEIKNSSASFSREIRLNVAAGIYFVKVSDEEKEYEQKLVIQ